MSQESLDQTINQQTENSITNTANPSNKEADFDITKFNAAYEEDAEARKKVAREKERKKLAALNKAPPKKKIYQLSIGEVLIGIKDTWFEIIDDLLQQKFSFDIFTKSNRLFFIGLTVSIIVLIIYLYELLTEDETEINANKVDKVKEVHHIYHLMQSPDGNTKNNKLPGISSMTATNFHSLPALVSAQKDSPIADSDGSLHI
jgi:hypothetical protein